MTEKKYFILLLLALLHKD